MSVQELGDLDGVQMWWCPDCQAVAPAMKRNKAPEIQHAADCGNAKTSSAAPATDAAPVGAVGPGPTAEELAERAAGKEVQAAETAPSPQDASQK